MEPTSDNELRLALEALRPEPRPAFAAELDARVAAGFPRDSRAPGFASSALDWLRSLKPRQVLLPAGAAAVTLLLVVGVVVSQNVGDGSNRVELSMRAGGDDTVAAGASEPGSDTPAGSAPEASEEVESGTVYESEETAVPDTSSSGGTSGNASATGPERPSDGFAGAGRQQRAIERSSQITLGTEPENVGKASSEVFDVVHDYRGVVLRSQTSDGSAAHGEAEFELLIPSGQLGDAMAAFSRIAEVRSRHEATNDITAPTVSATEQLEDSRARIDSLLGQLAAAETEGEREAVERELREERSRAAALQASLDNLERRASLSRVSLRIVGGEGVSGDEGGAWGIGDALDDAGQILAVSAAVTLLALAVLGPLALIALLIWLVRRSYLRRARQTALG